MFRKIYQNYSPKRIAKDISQNGSLKYLCKIITSKRLCFKPVPQSGASKLFSKAAPENCSTKLLPKAAPQSCILKLFPKLRFFKAAVQSCSSKLLLLPKAAPNLFRKAVKPLLEQVFSKIYNESRVPKKLPKAARTG